MTRSGPLKEVGFYDSAEDISVAARSTENHWETTAARYLEQGKTVVTSPGWVDDLLNVQARRICRYSALTDGFWVWSSDLVYYLRTYHVVLPDEFLTHMASRDWVTPEIDDAEMDAICKRLQQQRGGGV